MMNKKAASSLMRLTVAVIFLFIVFKVGAGIVKPLLNPESKTLAFQSFDNLVWKIDSLKDPNNFERSSELLLSLEPGYIIMGFDKGADKVKECIGNIEIPRPPECKEASKFACLCLMKKDGKNYKTLKCKQYEEPIIFYTDETGSKFNGYIGCEKISGLSIDKYDDEAHKKMKSLVLGKEAGARGFYDNMYLEVVNIGDTIYAHVDNPETPTFNMISASKKKNMYVMVAKKDAFNSDIRPKITNVCPANSEGDCGAKNNRAARTFDGIYKENNQLFYCSFNRDKQLCENKTIELCKTNSVVEKECACQGLMIDTGFCLSNKVYVEKYEYKPSTKCEDYHVPLNCVYNIAEVNSAGCYMTPDSIKNRNPSLWQIFVTSANPICIDCPVGPKKLKACNEYEEEWSCKADACNVLSGLDDLYCDFDASTTKCTQEISPNSEKFCEKYGKGCVYYFTITPHITIKQTYKCDYFDAYKDYCKKNILASSCDFYDAFYDAINTPKDHKQRTEDPCDCDWDEKFPDDGCTTP